MSSSSISSATSHTSSNSSSSSMASVATQQSTHRYLTPSHASTISSWTSSLPERNSSSFSEPELDARSHEAAIEAYRQLKMSLFSKANSNTSKFA
ncbi:hypothetical protein BDW02DRAFT_574175 [Decorospora gaudefroyi]|uniref:Uncharacterized protein n=1 Tax=Decorospora gaudefroyi TaxID=184978 RepID=A0A6A5JZL5_9PLEO|nr:hypothetical protein BDW02DRAFT_574175 [Decorospora gaudefroyi]